MQPGQTQQRIGEANSLSDPQTKMTSSQGTNGAFLTKPGMPTKKQVDYLTEAILENLG